MFQFSGSPSVRLCIHRTVIGYCPTGLPHSEIRGSMDICSSPRLIAACHVLLRLLMPRHPPCTLLSLILSRELIIRISEKRFYQLPIPIRNNLIKISRFLVSSHHFTLRIIQFSKCESLPFPTTLKPFAAVRPCRSLPA